MKINSTLIFTAIAVFFFVAGFGQKKIVILGSSTAFGIGATPVSNSWAGLYTNYLQSVNHSTVVVNLAVPGFVTYQILPVGLIPPAGRPVPEINNNITAAIALKPDAIIISLTSNDAATNYTAAETENNLLKVYNAAKAAGIAIWFTTTAPRNLDKSQISLQTAVRDWILNYFGSNSIDFWTTLATADGTVKPEYQYEDGIHFNNAGHQILFGRVTDKNILTGSVLAVKFGDIKIYAKQGGVQLEWKVLMENEIAEYEVQESADGLNFYKIASVLSLGNGDTGRTYSWSDKNKSVKDFYRVVSISKQGSRQYSSVVRINSTASVKELFVYPNPVSNNLINIDCKNFEAGNYTITLTSQGGQQQVKQFKMATGTSITTFPIGKNTAAGVYQLQVNGSETNITKTVFKN